MTPSHTGEPEHLSGLNCLIARMPPLRACCAHRPAAAPPPEHSNYGRAARRDATDVQAVEAQYKHRLHDKVKPPPAEKVEIILAFKSRANASST